MSFFKNPFRARYKIEKESYTHTPSIGYGSREVITYAVYFRKWNSRKWIQFYSTIYLETAKEAVEERKRSEKFKPQKPEVIYKD